MPERCARCGDGRPPRERGASAIPSVLLALVIIAVGGVAAVVLLRSGGKDPSREGNEFSYDVKALLAVDPALILYEELGAFDVGFREPRAIAADPASRDRALVVGDRALRVFEVTGAPRLVSELALDGPPQCVDVTRAGLWYVGFRDHVEVVDATSKRRSAWESLGPSAMVVSLAATSSGVYVGDAGQRIVWRFDLEGKRLGALGKRDEARNIPGFVVPSPHLDVAMGPDGLLRVVDPGRHRIEAYTPDGDLELHWGKASMTVDGFSGCCNPCALAIVPGGGFVTCEKGIPRVKEYDATGAFVGVVAAPDRFEEGRRALREDWREGSGGGLDVAVDTGGRVLVLDPLAGKVMIFSRKKETR